MINLAADVIEPMACKKIKMKKRSVLQTDAWTGFNGGEHESPTAAGEGGKRPINSDNQWKSAVSTADIMISA